MGGFIARIVLLVLMIIDFALILLAKFFFHEHEGENKADVEAKVRKFRNYLYIIFGVLLIVFILVAALAKR